MPERIASIKNQSDARTLSRFNPVACFASVLLSFAISTVLVARQRESPTAQVTVDAGAPECTVQLDADAPAKSDAQGKAYFREVDPSDHYVHVHCRGQEERGQLISPHAEENLRVRVAAAAVPANSAQNADPNQEPAEAKIKLRELVKQAVQLRTQARLDEAVKQLREAAELDPENSDLHRELGITFLLAKEWKRARVEMLEAIRHDPTDADAHNALGYALEKLGEVQPALDQYRVASRLDPDDPSYRQHYLDALARQASEQPVKEKKR
jgi:hypothetical protein